LLQAQRQTLALVIAAEVSVAAASSAMHHDAMHAVLSPTKLPAMPKLPSAVTTAASPLHSAAKLIDALRSSDLLSLELATTAAVAHDHATETPEFGQFTPGFRTARENLERRSHNRHRLGNGNQRGQASQIDKDAIAALNYVSGLEFSEGQVESLLLLERVARVD